MKLDDLKEQYESYLEEMIDSEPAITFEEYAKYCK